MALSVAAPDGETDQTNVACHCTEQVGDTCSNLTELLASLCPGQNRDILLEHSSKDEEQDTWDL